MRPLPLTIGGPGCYGIPKSEITPDWLCDPCANEANLEAMIVSAAGYMQDILTDPCMHARSESAMRLVSEKDAGSDPDKQETWPSRLPFLARHETNRGL